MNTNGRDDDFEEYAEHADEQVRLTRDLVVASRTMGPEEARYMVDAYYQTQENRKRTENQVRSLEGEPHFLIEWMADKNWTLEQQIARALKEYTANHPMGQWMRGIVGIGPVLSAGFLAHIHMGQWCQTCRAIDARQCERRQERELKKAKAKKRYGKHTYVPVDSLPTVGHIWQFAGIAGSGQKPWEKGKVRPFNADLKVLCWKAGQSFMKLSSREDCYYGKVYRERKAYEIANNESGALADAAARSLPHFKPTTEAYKYYKAGKLPPAHIDARARRYAVKLFLSHLHGEWFQQVFGRPAPLPYPIAYLNHVHFIPAPQRFDAPQAQQGYTGSND